MSGRENNRPYATIFYFLTFVCIGEYSLGDLLLFSHSRQWELFVAFCLVFRLFSFHLFHNFNRHHHEARKFFKIKHGLILGNFKARFLGNDPLAFGYEFLGELVLHEVAYLMVSTYIVANKNTMPFSVMFRVTNYFFSFI